MKKDINIPEVKNVTVAIIRREIEGKKHVWEVYLINTNDHQIDNILAVSHGYGIRNNQKVKTSTMRSFFERLDPHSSMMIEPIDPDLFDINNEIDVTYYIGKDIYFKKFIFVEGSIVEKHIRHIPILGMEGVLHF